MGGGPLKGLLPKKVHKTLKGQGVVVVLLKGCLLSCVKGDPPVFYGVVVLCKGCHQELHQAVSFDSQCCSDCLIGSTIVAVLRMMCQLGLFMKLAWSPDVIQGSVQEATPCLTSDTVRQIQTKFRLV